MDTHMTIDIKLANVCDTQNIEAPIRLNNSWSNMGKNIYTCSINIIIILLIVTLHNGKWFCPDLTSLRVQVMNELILTQWAEIKQYSFYQTQKADWIYFPPFPHFWICTMHWIQFDLIWLTNCVTTWLNLFLVNMRYNVQWFQHAECTYTSSNLTPKRRFQRIS